MQTHISLHNVHIARSVFLIYLLSIFILFSFLLLIFYFVFVSMAVFVVRVKCVYAFLRTSIKVKVKAVCGSYSTAALRHIVLLRE